MNNKTMKKIWAGILVISMVFGLVGIPANVQTVMAEVSETVGAQAKTVNLQIDGNIFGITDPSAPVDTAVWSGSKVYFGKYNNNPLLFRVLDANTTDYSADGTTKTMLLDSDVVLDKKVFNSNNTDNLWKNSDVKTWLQGTGANQFLNQFSAIEKGAIITSNKNQPSTTDGKSGSSFAPLENDTVFVLDVAELRNTSYGLSATDLEATNRIKQLNGADAQWWTRSPLTSGNKDYVSLVHTNGKFTNAPILNGWALGVSPAMNLDLSSILFTSASGQNKGSFAMTEDSNSNTWNLTLAGGKGFTATVNDTAIVADEDIIVNITNLGTALDSSALSDGYYSQVSAMLLDKNGTVLAYGKISDAVTGNVSFAVPEGIEKGTYTLKVFAEKVNSSASNNATDYASNMASFEINYLMEETKNINLQINGEISGITDPSAPVDTEAWTGSKVYFGKYGNNPVLFRVLDANTTDYSADETTETMLMGSDTLFQARAFNASGSDNTWANSDIKVWMQGSSDGQFLRQFSETEKGAIFASNKAVPSNTDGALMGGGTFAPLVNDTVFALDVAEVGNTSYGYSYNTGIAVANRIMNLDGAPSVWWTRSLLNNANGNYVSIVYLNGKLTNTSAWKTTLYGVNPVMNLDLSSILYASAVGTTQTAELDEVGSDLVANNEWKLTLLDNSKIVGIQENKSAVKVGTTVTVPYTYSGNGINQLSVMMTSTDRTNAAAQVLYYGKLATVSGTEGSDSATFTLPENLPEGYKVYLIAEGINSGNFTSYASEPVEVDITTSEDVTMDPITLGTIYQSLDFGDYIIDFDGGAVVDGIEYAKDSTINSTGEYEIIYIESGKIYKRTLVLYRLGDLNTDNKVNVTDLVAMDEYLDKEIELSLSGYKAADITLDDEINKQDCNQLIQHLLNDEGFPITGYTAQDMEALVDFTVEVESGRDIRVLQLTDTQIIESEQQRYDDRLGVGSTAYEQWLSTNKDAMYRESVKHTIEDYNPDFIIITGDLVYGEFDDSGEALLEFISFMDSFQIPWAPVFGNHEIESIKGADWQCEQLEKSEYCMFKQRNLTGNGNYTVGLKQDGEYKRVFFMLDSNGCSKMSDESYNNGHSKKTAGFGTDQIEWYTDLSEKMRYAQPSLKLSVAFHIQLSKFTDAYAKYGFTNNNTANNPINIDTNSNKETTDFGYLGSDLKGAWDSDETVWYSFKNSGFDSIYVGHEHCNSASVVYRGIRFQYGQKSSAYDRANYIKSDGTVAGSYNFNTGTPVIGGTTIPINQDGSLGIGEILLYGID